MMFRHMAKILCASLILSSTVPAGVCADDLTDDFEVTSDFEDEDFSDESDFEGDTDELISDDDQTDAFLDETETFSETKLSEEIETEDESESESESESTSKKEKLIEEEEDIRDLFEAEKLLYDISAEMRNPDYNVYEMTLENVQGGTYRFQSYSNKDTFITVVDLNGDGLYTDDDSGQGNNFKLVCQLKSGHDYQVRVNFLDWEIIDTLPFKIYREMPYTITYDANGGSGAPDVQELPQKTGKVKLSNTKPNKYLTLTYDANGGKVDPAEKQVSLPFSSWHKDKACSTTGYMSGASIQTNGSMTLYAKYGKNASVGTLATPIRSGYVFAGWYTAKTGGTKVTAATKISGNKTIYAHWAADQTNYGNTIEGFIYRLYRNMLGREPDKTGMTYWKNQLTSGKMNGAQVADGFIHSNEFKGISMSDGAYIEILYNTFLNRSSDAQGMKYWQSKLNNGMSRDFVYSGFVNSTEFKNICKKYGIKTGSVTLTEARDKNEGVTTFIVRCYRKFLGRGADANGLNYWCNILLSGSMDAKDVAEGFVNSTEFKTRYLNDEEFIKTMYQGLFDRNADSTGIKYWGDKLWAGLDRNDVFYGFADSTEFRKLVQSFNLNSNWANSEVDIIYDGGRYTLIIPKRWKGKYVVVNESTGPAFCEKTNYDYFKKLYGAPGGRLFSIVITSDSQSVFANYEILSRSGSNYYYALYPSDVNFAYDNNKLLANYNDLNYETGAVVDSFRLKKQ